MGKKLDSLNTIDHEIDGKKHCKEREDFCIKMNVVYSVNMGFQYQVKFKLPISDKGVTSSHWWFDWFTTVVANRQWLKDDF